MMGYASYLVWLQGGEGGGGGRGRGRWNTLHVMMGYAVYLVWLQVGGGGGGGAAAVGKREMGRSWRDVGGR